MQSILTLLVIFISLFPHPTLFDSEQQEGGVGHRLGVTVSAESISELTTANLIALQDIGVTLIELKGRVPEEDLERITDAGLFIFVQQNRLFSTRSELEANRSLFIEQDRALIQYYESRAGEQVSAYGLFHFPDESTTSMLQSMSNYVGQLRSIVTEDLSFYYISAFPDEIGTAENYNFRSELYFDEDSISPTPVIHFDSNGLVSNDLEIFRDLLAQSLEQTESIIMIDYSWLMDKIDQFGLLRNTLRTYTLDQSLLFPLPSMPETSLPPNWPVILLITALATFILHYRFNYQYQKSLPRYFTTHKFFIDDVLENRIRIPFTAVLLFIQIIFLSGIFSVILVKILFSTLGIEALYTHFPFLQFFGADEFSFFLWGMLLTFFIQILSVIWLYLPARKIVSMSQTLILYIWPLQANLLTLIIIVSIYQSNGTEFWLYFLSIIFVLMWIISFTLTSVKIVRRMKKRRFIYIFSTMGLQAILILSLIYLVFLSEYAREVVRLAYHLP